MLLTYEIKDVEPYINWIYFNYAWGLTGKAVSEKKKLRQDAEVALRSWYGHYHTQAIFALFDSYSDGDDLIIGSTRLPLLRQQHEAINGQPNLCLSDFVHPVSSGIKDIVGVFAVSVDASLITDGKDNDAYNKMLTQTLADRLAEATTEKMHEEVRTKYWGYSHDEHLTIDELHKEKYQGIRPAIGYPSLPDTSVNFIISDLIDFNKIGIRLTSNGMMTPHASVSGLMFSHPKATYFNLGKVGEDQLVDYAHRRGLPVELVRKYLKPIK